MQKAADTLTGVAAEMGGTRGRRLFELVQDHPFTANDDYPAFVVTRREPTFESENSRGTIYSAGAKVRAAILVRRRGYSAAELEALWQRFLREVVAAGHVFRLTEAQQYEAQITGNALRIAVLHLTFEDTLDLTAPPE